MVISGRRLNYASSTRSSAECTNRVKATLSCSVRSQMIPCCSVPTEPRRSGTIARTSSEGTVALSHHDAMVESPTGRRSSLAIAFALFRRRRRGSQVDRVGRADYARSLNATVPSRPPRRRCPMPRQPKGRRTATFNGRGQGAETSASPLRQVRAVWHGRGATRTRRWRCRASSS